MTDIRKRMLALRRAVVDYIYVQDALFLEPPEQRLFALSSGFALNNEMELATKAQKVKAFRLWLKQQVDNGLLEVDGEFFEKPWMAPHVDSAYKKAVVRSYLDAKKGIAVPEQAAFMTEAFTSPVALEQLELLYTRNFTKLEGITNAMDTQMSSILTEGMAHGHGPRQIAGEMAKSVDKMTKTRAMTLARTEIIHAYAEGQLDSFERLGIKELGVEIEWSTAGDDRVCPLCQDMEGKIYTTETARGVIPIHPNCRCAWIPYFPKDPTVRSSS